jgi:hypothetical protein
MSEGTAPMSDEEKPVSEMTKAEFTEAKRRMFMKSRMEDKEQLGAKFMEKLDRRHANPPQPVKVKPIRSENRTAPVADGLMKLF